MADINENGASAEAFLEVKNLNKYFSVETNFFGKPIKFLKAVDGVSFSLQKGKTLGIVGESGCGKTTLGRTILRLYDITGGEVKFKGQTVSTLKNREFDKLRPNMQMIFQDPYASLSPRLTVGEIIGEAARQHKIVDKAHYRDYIMEVMKMCGLQPHYFERYPHEFSGGQRQRICIARALALKPELVICDEPVSALDVSIQAQIINMLIELRKTLGLTYVFISHDLSVVKHISDEVGVMYLGSMVEYGSKRDIFDNTLHPYTKALFSAVPVPNPHVKMNRIILKGDIPSPVNPPQGCKFHTRCEKCMERCERLKPIYKEIEPGHFCACHLYDTEEDIKQMEAEYEREQKELAEKQAKQAKLHFWQGWSAKLKKKNKNGEESAKEVKPEIKEEVSSAAEEAVAEAPATEAQITEVPAAEEKTVTKAPAAEETALNVSEDTKAEEVKANAPTAEELDDIPTVAKETAQFDIPAVAEEESFEDFPAVAEGKIVVETPVALGGDVVNAAVSENTSETDEKLQTESAEEKKPAVKPAAKKTTSTGTAKKSTSSTAKKTTSTGTAKKTTLSTAKKATSTGTAKKSTSTTARKTTSTGTVKKSTSSTVKKTTSTGTAKKTASSTVKKTTSTGAAKSNPEEVKDVPKE